MDTTTHTLLVPARVKPSTGDVTMLFALLVPGVAEDVEKEIPAQPARLEMHQLGNNYENHWYTLQPGTQVTLIAGVDKTDTYCAVIREPIADGQLGAPKGMVLRAMAWQNVLKAAVGEEQEIIRKRREAAALKAAQQAAKSQPKAGSPSAARQPSVVTVNLGAPAPASKVQEEQEPEVQAPTGTVEVVEVQGSDLTVDQEKAIEAAAPTKPEVTASPEAKQPAKGKGKDRSSRRSGGDEDNQEKIDDLLG